MLVWLLQFTYIDSVKRQQHIYTPCGTLFLLLQVCCGDFSLLHEVCLTYGMSVCCLYLYADVTAVARYSVSRRADFLLHSQTSYMVITHVTMSVLISLSFFSSSRVSSARRSVLSKQPWFTAVTAFVRATEYMIYTWGDRCRAIAIPQPNPTVQPQEPEKWQ